MNKQESEEKIQRVLGIYSKLMEGAVVNKAKEAINYGVNEKSIQRDIEDIRKYIDKNSAETGYINSVIYDRTAKGYRLEQLYKLKLDNSEILAICKILLDSRAFTKNEISEMLHKLIECCVPIENQQVVKELIRNEEFHYVEPRHGVIFIDKIWEIGKAIREQRFIEIKYQGLKGSTVKKRKLKPLAIMFSEYYFYLVAVIDDDMVRENFNVIDDTFPTIYRIDRIQRLKVLDEKYQVYYANRFEEGEFRKRIQFMFGGKLRKIKFKYSGYSIEAVLDRLPTAKILSENEGEYVIAAEVFGDGIDMWIRSQGDKVEVLGGEKNE